MKKYLPWLAAAASAVFAAHGQIELVELDVRLKITQEQLAQATDNNFSLASACEQQE